jgi:hypothetical protein
MDNNITNALITSGIGSAVYIAYKIIQHYRIHSSCNQDNQLVIEVVNVDDKAKQQPDSKQATEMV